LIKTEIQNKRRRNEFTLF